MARSTKVTKTNDAPRYVTLRPTMVAQSVAAAVNTSPPRPLMSPMPAQSRDSWEIIHELSDAIGQGILVMANNLNETVEMVKQLGCEHMAEFGVAVNKTNEDMLKFSEDYRKVRDRHATKSGPIVSPDDAALSLSIAEDYRQFQAFFDGVMHHTMITFTEFALEAKDFAKAKLDQEAKTITLNPSEPVAHDE